MHRVIKNDEINNKNSYTHIKKAESNKYIHTNANFSRKVIMKIGYRLWSRRKDKYLVYSI